MFQHNTGTLNIVLDYPTKYCPVALNDPTFLNVNEINNSIHIFFFLSSLSAEAGQDRVFPTGLKRKQKKKSQFVVRQKLTKEI